MTMFQGSFITALASAMLACSASVDGPTTLGEGDRDATGPADAGQPPQADNTPSGQADPDAPAPPPLVPDIDAPTRRTHANLLFSGHSLLYRPIPELVAAIAETRGDSNDWEMQGIGGSPIRVRTRGQNTNSSGWSGYHEGENRNGDGMDILAEIADPNELAPGQHYDTLVITERHDPLDTMVWEGTLGYLRDYHDRMTAALPSARTLYWQCWPDIDKDDPERWVDYVRLELAVWECGAAKVNLSLEAENRATSVVVVPGALVLARLVEEALANRVPGISGSSHERLDQLFTDNVHPTQITSYALAAAVYAAVYGASPVGASASADLSTATMTVLESIAWEVISTYQAAVQSRRQLATCRSYIAGEVCPEYYAIRDRSGECSDFSDANGPLRWPDDALPY